MSLIPAFEIGMWNAWIFMLGYFLPYLLWCLTSQGKAVSKKMKETSVPVKHERTVSISFMIVMFGALIYSVFLPLQLGTLWFFIGLIIFSIAEIMYIAILMTIHFTSLDQPFTTGLYRYSRHPIYLMQLSVFTSVAIACVSWMFLLFAIIIGILQYIVVPSEEQDCLEKYGDAYKEYMDRTPRWIGLPKSRKN
jgi:protein-S-isoprenylcysteine O-methyltransferase Ste14